MVSAEGIAAMAASGSVAVLLPGAFYFLRETKVPPVPALREAGVPMAIASDHNPGSSPGLSLLLMLNMACTLFRLTPEEALRGVTVHGARALGLHDAARCRPANARTSRSGPSNILPSSPTGSATILPSASSSAAARDGPCERRHLHVAPWHDAAARQRAARRRRDSCRRRGAARAAGLDVEDADRHLDSLYAFANDLGAGLLVPRFARYVVDLNRPPENAPMYPGLNNTELCPTRFFSGNPLYRDGVTPDDAEVRRRVGTYWRPSTSPSLVSWCGCMASTVTRCCSTATASRPSCPGCSKAGCRI